VAALVLVGDPRSNAHTGWRRALRLLALAVGDHLLVDLAIRAADLTAQLQRAS
jgi:hypothetical protein